MPVTAKVTVVLLKTANAADVLSSVDNVNDVQVPAVIDVEAVVTDNAVGASELDELDELVVEELVELLAVDSAEVLFEESDFQTFPEITSGSFVELAASLESTFDLGSNLKFWTEFAFAPTVEILYFGLDLLEADFDATLGLLPCVAGGIIGCGGCGALAPGPDTPEVSAPACDFWPRPAAATDWGACDAGDLPA